MKTRQARLTEPGRFEIGEIELSPGPDQVLVKVRACGLCAWELNHWKGRIASYPDTPGHEVAGIVEAVGSEVKSFEPGQPVTCFGWAGFADYTIAKESDCCRVSEKIPLSHALGEPLSCVVTTLDGAGAEAGDFGVVMGCGPMGLWCVQILAESGLAGLIAVDVSEDRLFLAKKFGATHVINPKKDSLTDSVKEITGGRMADFVIEGTGRPEAIGTAIEIVKTGRGRIALMSSHEDVGPPFDWRPAMEKGVQIMVTHPAYAADRMDNMRRAVALMEKGVINSEEIITHRFPLGNIEEAFRTLERKPADYIKGIVELY